MFFLVLTAPVGAHMIARTAYHKRITMWKDTVMDEYENNIEEKGTEQKEQEH
ncbi:putative monovalent cation/H+ antiporter subunit G [compost metagenome]